MKRIDVDKLIGSKSQPVAELVINGETKVLYAFDDMPERVAVRTVQASANYEAIAQEVDREIAILEKEEADAKVRGESDKAKDTLTARKVAAESKMSAPLRELVEAMFDVEPGSLGSLTPRQVSEIMKEVNELVFPSKKKEAIPPPEEAPAITEVPAPTSTAI